MPPVADAHRAVAVVAPDDCGNPTGGVAGGGDRGGRFAAGEQPDNLPLAAADGIAGAAIARLDFGNDEMVGDAPWPTHCSSIQPDSVLAAQGCV
jgi:hypothetical protein